MRGNGLSFVAAACQHYRRPEGGELLLMLRPVADRVVENRRQRGIGADASEKASTNDFKPISSSSSFPIATLQIMYILCIYIWMQNHAKTMHH
jgi:hypothetical protein